MPIAIRGGAHNVAGHAVCDGGVMVDLSLMRGVRVDPERRLAWVEGGATWGDVDRATQAFGLATPGGLISDTGVAGLTLSGGIGWLRSRHGLCIDNLASAEVATADGRLVRASPEENADLLWALKGGGGNFGVVTGFEFNLHPVGPEVMFCAPIYPIEAGSRAYSLLARFPARQERRCRLADRILDHTPGSRLSARGAGERGSIRWPRSTPVLRRTAKICCSRCGSLPSL